MEPRDYQREAIDALIAAWKEEGLSRSAMIAATGSGKTVTFSHLIKQVRTEHGIGRVLVVAHREELLTQAVATLKAVLPGKRVEIMQGGTTSRGKLAAADVIVASIQTLAVRKRCHRKIQRRSNGPMVRCGTCPNCTRLVNAAKVSRIDAVICDEAHHSASDSYRRVFNWYGAFDGVVPLWGFTATMTREAGGLAQVWEKVAYTIGTKELVDQGYLVPPHAKQVVIPGMDLDQAKLSHGDFTAQSLAELMLNSDAMSDIAKAYITYASDRPGLVFTPNVETAHAMAAAFTAEGITCEAVWGSMPDEERRAVLKRFKHGDTQVIANCMLLTEGFDEPKASCVVIARPTKSRGLYCFDSETEVLTPQGWRYGNTLTEGDTISAFDPNSSSVQWEQVQTFVERPLYGHEHMLSVSSPTVDLRVTNTHRMVFRTKSKGNTWRIADAGTVSRYRNSWTLPVAGYGEFTGASLSDAEVALVGWVQTDGHINKHNNALTISQQNPDHCAEIEDILTKCGFKWRVKTDEHFTNFGPRTHPLCTYRVSRGAPRGEDKHLSGWEKMSPWIAKADPSAWNRLNDLNYNQWRILLNAMHKANGAKQEGQYWTRRSYHISTPDKIMAEWLQAGCVQRGWRANISSHTNDHGSILYYVHCRELPTRVVGGTGQHDRPHLKPSKTAPGERVWCVSVPSGALVTRRNGKVAVMGNTQMVGRGMRLSEETGKQDLLILDVHGATTRHSLATLDDVTNERKAKAAKGQSGDDEDDPGEVEEAEPEEETELGSVGAARDPLEIAGWRDVEDLFDAAGEAAQVRWVKSPGGTWFAPITQTDESGKKDKLTVFMVPAGQPGHVHMRLMSAKSIDPPPGDPVTSSDQALKHLTAAVLNRRTDAIDRPKARWRSSRQVGAGQWEFASKVVREEIPENPTKGEIGDLIDKWTTGKRIDAYVGAYLRGGIK